MKFETANVIVVTYAARPSNSVDFSFTELIHCCGMVLTAFLVSNLFPY